MPQLSEKTEGLLWGITTGSTALATGIWTQPLPTEVKAPISAVSALTALVVGAFWYGFVNKKPIPTTP